MGSDWLERYHIKQLPRSRKRKRKRKLRSLFDIPYDTTERCDTCKTELELHDGCWHCKNCGFTKS